MILRSLQFRQQLPKTNRLFIFSDSSYAILAVRASKPYKPHLTNPTPVINKHNIKPTDDNNLQIKTEANSLFYSQDTILVKVPAHLDEKGMEPIKGNEIADHLAKKAADEANITLQHDPHANMLNLPIYAFAIENIQRNDHITLATFLQTRIRCGRNHEACLGTQQDTGIT